MQRELEDIGDVYLGSGYDVCGEYADGVSIKKRLFDLSKVPKHDIRRVPNTSADYFSVHGTSYEKYQKSLAAKAGLSGEYGLFSASVKSSFSTTDLTISQSGYVSIKLFLRYSTLKLQVRSQDYMYPQVVEDFKKLDGETLIERYGAAVVMGLDIGGQWSDNFTVSKLYEHATSDVAVSMEAAYGSFVSGSGSSKIQSAIETQKSIASRRVNVVGGDPKFAPGHLDQWQASVQANPAFMNFTPTDGLVWIWKFFPEYEDKLKKGLDAYIKSQAVDVPQENLIQCQTVDGYQYASDKGSGAKSNLALYAPATSDVYKYVGVNGNDNRIVIIKELSANYGALHEVQPDEWHLVWNDRGSGNSHDYSCWMPIAPPNYVALGVFCRFGVYSQNPPDKNETKGFVVMHESFVDKIDATVTLDNVWSDAGSGADHSLSLGRLPHDALWPTHTSDPKAGILPAMYTLKKKYCS